MTSSDKEVAFDPHNDCIKNGHFIGQNEMDVRVRTFDWSQTPLGDPGEWPQNLNFIVQILLTCDLRCGWVGVRI